MTASHAGPSPDEPTTAAEAGGGPAPALARLWAGWRNAYVTEASAAARDPQGSGKQSLFERLLASDLSDEQTHILRRSDRCFAILNAYPYGSGHLLVLPNRAVADLDGLDGEESAELWGMVQAAVRAIRSAYRPDGMNVGMNLGAAAGAGVPDHLHVHCLPRWSADTNFMTAIAESRILPEPLAVSWKKLTAAWPD